MHRLVLDGAVPELARHFPSAGGTPTWPAAWEAFLKVVDEHREYLRGCLLRQVQTNEVSRCAALLGGFLEIAARTGLPLRLLEIGSSAGLNLGWDRYRYELGTFQWGDPSSPLVIRSPWHGRPAALQSAEPPPSPLLGKEGRSLVVERAGCDIAPIDITDPVQVRMLESFIWPEQADRFVQLRAAVALAQRDPPRLTRARAADWLAERLAEPSDGVTTVLFHSVMWWYLSEAEREQVTRLIEQRGARAGERNPFAWLQMEIMRSQKADIVLRLWPGGEPQVLGITHPHGKEVWWGKDVEG